MSKKILIVSDLHFSENNTLLFKKIDVERNFDILLNGIKHEKPDYIFLLGDISQDGSNASYLKVKAKLDYFACKKFIIMGNHDSNNIQTLLSENIFMEDSLDIYNHRFIFMSSYKGNNADDGYVTDLEFAKAKNLLGHNKLNYLLVHHHFINTNGIIDGSIMENHIQFSNFIINNPINAVFHGHVHNNYNIQLGNTNIYAAPSTCVQFDLKKTLNLTNCIGYQTVTLMDNKYEHKVIIKNI